MRSFVIGLCLALIAASSRGQVPAAPSPTVSATDAPPACQGVKLADGSCGTATLSEQAQASMQAAVHNVQGLAYKHGGQLKLALAEYDAALALDPNNAEALDNRGVIWNAQGKYDRALADYNRALKLSPSDASAYYNRGNTYANMGLTEKAIADFRLALHLDSSLQMAREALKVFGAKP